MRLGVAGGSEMSRHAGSSRRKFLRDRERCASDTVSSRRLRIPGFEKEFVHDTEDLVARLEDAGGIEVLPDLAEHVTSLGVERVHGEAIRIGRRICGREA